MRIGSIQILNAPGEQNALYFPGRPTGSKAFLSTRAMQLVQVQQHSSCACLIQINELIASRNPGPGLSNFKDIKCFDTKNNYCTVDSS